jgi:hypothetical protein
MSQAGTLSLQAMSLDLPATPGHPNKLRFTGILARIDVPSTGAPEGSGGKRIILTAQAAKGALASLLGMAIDFRPGLDGHDPRRKIGIIDCADIENDALTIGGILYAADFPDLIDQLRTHQGVLGFSFEATQVEVADGRADPLIIQSCVFTGAAVLRKDRAAFQTTSFQTGYRSQEACMAVSAEIQSSDQPSDSRAAPAHRPIPVAKIGAHVGALRLAAQAMRQDGVGLHPLTGHAALICMIADDMARIAEAGAIPFALGPGSNPAPVNDAPEPNSDSDGAANDLHSQSGDARAVRAGSGIGQTRGDVSKADTDMIARNMAVAARPLFAGSGFPRRITRVNARMGDSPAQPLSLDALGHHPRPLAEWDRLLADLPVAQRLELKVSLRQRDLIA